MGSSRLAVVRSPAVAKVTGIGGVFLRARNPERMAEWIEPSSGVIKAIVTP